MVDAFFDYDLVFPWKILHEDELAVSPLYKVCASYSIVYSLAGPSQESAL